MIKKLIVLYLFLIVPHIVFSQDTSKIIINREQLVTTNLIFLEHNKMQKIIPLLEQKISNLEKIDSSWKHKDSLLRKCYNDSIIGYQNKIKNLNNKIDKKTNVIRYGFLGSLAVIILCLFVK